MRVIGITGKARAGKDTCGEWFRDRRGAYVTSFAWPIKEAVKLMFALEPAHFDGQLKEEPLIGLERSPRYLAQTLGTEWGRELVGPDVWVFAMERRLREARLWYMGDALIVVTDVRFDNEADWVRQHGTLLHVTRPGADGNVGVLGHASEAGVLEAAGDILIANTGTVQELHEKLDIVFPQRGGR